MSKGTTEDGFDDRDGWQMQMQTRFAMPVYRAYWAVDDEEITEVDKCAKTETAARVFDADGCTDKAVTPSTGMRYIAQRFRTRQRGSDGRVYDPDFSIRTQTYSDADTEYDKLMNAWRNGGNVPAIYAFGIADAFTRDAAKDNGFREFYFLKLKRFLKLVDNGQLDPVAAYPNGDGSKALYYSIDSLRNNRVVQDGVSGGVLMSAWQAEETSDRFPTAPGIKTTGQVELFSFGDGDE
jgi:hypothetical protein